MFSFATEIVPRLTLISFDPEVPDLRRFNVRVVRAIQRIYKELQLWVEVWLPLSWIWAFLPVKQSRNIYTGLF